MRRIPKLTSWQQYLTGWPIFAVLSATFLMAAPPVRAADSNDILQAVVGIKADVPSSARTSRFLGTERVGSGVVIDSDGLVLTIGYLILEAVGATVTGPDGKEYPAKVVAYDHDTGFGLLRAQNPAGLRPIRLGDSAKLSTKDQVLIVARGGPQPVIAARVVSRRNFIGYWEYVSENAIFTSPPHGFHSGAALIGGDGRLLGIGSLFVNDAAAPGQALPGNMFVPVNGLKPVLADLLDRGRRSGPKKPWIGVNTNEIFGRVIVSRVSPGGPGDRAGIKAGDIILGIQGEPINDQHHFYKQLWSSGEAGTTVPLHLLPKGAATLSGKRVEVRTMDRYDWLQMSPTF